MVASQTTISCDFDRLSYDRACDIANQAVVIGGKETIHIGLHSVVETTTAALARLVALRCKLHRSGRNLIINGLHGQAENLYRFNKMADLLPCDWCENDSQNVCVQ